MISTWLFIIIFNTAGAQTIEMNSLYECEQLKAFTDNEITKQENLKGKVMSGCFKNLGERNKKA
jgi:hypothetical protein